MIRSASEVRFLLMVLGAAVCAGAFAAPNFPDRYIDPDDLVDVEEIDDALWPGGLDAFADSALEVFETRGRVEDVSYEGPRLLVNGLVYGFALEADVRLRAGAGAPSLIAPGMMLEFYFTTADAEPGTAGRILAAIEMDSALAEPQ
ncbi:MAG: hypothetical protein MK142_04215 [Pseudomonadales bacterium]|nr:hypothetical protein [Pseudomonadales bacterium]